MNKIGLNIPNTHGQWPNGGGSNPGDLGEDVRVLSSGTVETNPGNSPLSSCN